MWIFDLINASNYLSTIIALIVGLINIMYTLKSYRENMLELYRGDHTNIPPALEKNASSDVLAFIRYAGYQVAFIIGGYAIQSVVLFLVILLLGIVIKLVDGQLMILILRATWPFVLILLTSTIIPVILVPRVFLQERDVLALDNRRFLFTFTYYMFFVSILIGIVACLRRILVGTLIGLRILPLLYISYLPRGREDQDYGYMAYVGFLHVECAHTHPVMLTFVHLLQLGIYDKGQRVTGEAFDNLNYSHFTNPDAIETGSVSRRSHQPLYRWRLAYTLVRNPNIRVLRKFCLRNQDVLPTDKSASSV